MVIDRYYQAWRTNDIVLLKEVIHPNLFGIRDYQETVLFDVKQLLDYFEETNEIDYQITHLVEEKEVYHLDLTVGNTRIASKILVKDGLIYKVYETKKTPNRRIKCICSYDGSEYSGYQKQKSQNSIQETIETALTKAFQQPISIQSSGRTDKGVHALHQVFHFDVDTQVSLDNMMRLINSYLPESIHVFDLDQVRQTFHARYDVKQKEYQYVINTKEYNPIQRHYEWFVEDIDFEVLKRELTSIIGTHDFTSFTKTTKESTIRSIYDVTVKEEENHIYINITANGFLRYMVRNIVGAAVMISKGKLAYSLRELLRQKDVNLLKDKAPANGLYLYHVKY
jgi:tRNA pseudouridine38-40 synthase